MKNGISLKGHRRILEAVGTRPAPKRLPPGGFNISCLCGWKGGNYSHRTPAAKFYREHLDNLVATGKFTCLDCGESRFLSEMRPDYRYMCKSCFSLKGLKWQANNPEQTARHKREHHLRKTFGMSLAQAETLLVDQGGVCAICKTPIVDKRGWSPHVDHDHKTGKVRGILCFHCNSGLGHFKDNEKLLLAAIDYLRKGPVHEGINANAALGVTRRFAEKENRDPQLVYELQG